ncbi:MAG: EscU/YscU/HrcU family type III secretion system export apparatus switch protein [Acidimicrobiia bacterium]
MSKDREQRTEAPTPKRKKEARERGQVAKSPELATWAALLAATVLVSGTISSAGTAFEGLMPRVSYAIAHPSLPRALDLLADGLVIVVVTLLPLMLGLMAVGVVTELAQVGLMPSFKRIRPKGERLSLIKGLRRIFSKRSLWETAKGVLRIVIIGAVAWLVLSATARALAVGGSFASLIATTGQAVLQVVRTAAAAGLVLAAIDYVVQRRRVQADLRMTRQEVREETRRSEGDPNVRAAVRQRQRAMSKNRMIAAVGESDVVLVNPTHYAVALRYQAEQGAPEVLAKGAGSAAAAIRAEAERHHIPLVEDPPLARALHRVCEVGERVPAELWEAVARVLAFVYQARQRGRPVLGIRRMPASAPLPEVPRRRRRSRVSLNSRPADPMRTGRARKARPSATSHGRPTRSEAR